MTTEATTRNYDAVLAYLSQTLRGSSTHEERMQAVVDGLWDELREKGCSWVGFYLKRPDADEMILGPRRDKPACSPIGMYGACGRAFQSNRPLVVTNVVNLHSGYIACDPRDRSELVLPVFATYNEPYGVLDLDSHDVHAFTRDDALRVNAILHQAGLTIPTVTHEIDIV